MLNYAAGTGRAIRQMVLGPSAVQIKASYGRPRAARCQHEPWRI